MSILISLLMQFAINVLLPKPFIQSIECVIVAYEENLFYIMFNSRSSIRSGGIIIHWSLITIRRLCNHTRLTIYTITFQLIHSFQRQQGGWQFHRGRWVIIFIRIKVEIIICKNRIIILIPINLGVYDLNL